MKKLFNTFKSKGHNIPKTAIIENSHEVREFIKENFPCPYENCKDRIKEDKSWLGIAFNASYIGQIYMHIFTETDKGIGMFNPSTVKDFIDFEAFKKYVNWAHKLPRYIVNQK